MRSLFLVIVIALFCACGGVSQEMSEAEQKALGQALGEAGSSPVELIRALEGHLAKYPLTSKRAEFERILTKAAIETRDDRRIVLYGERVLQREQDDLQILERVARALLVSDGKEEAARALKYAQQHEKLAMVLHSQDPPGRMGKGQWQDELDRSVGRALALEARATGNLGKLDEAIALARRSYDSFPTAEAAREIARWLMRTGHEEEALRHLADAFTIVDPRNSDADRVRDRSRMGEVYTKLKGSEKGLGDIVLAAYDRTTALVDQRRAKLGQSDPNSQATRFMEFTLTGLNGKTMPLGSLKGKAIVFDFWATWCGPCRAQHPLYEEVKRRFKDNPNVTFLSVNTDEERAGVEPFLKENKWGGQSVYFESGLAKNLQISSIPTTIVVDRRGEIISRMNGFVPERFVDMLSERIREALK
jgi:thiol-disulfide isomerase/thioredoxin